MAQTNVTFSDVAGLNAAKEMLYMAAILPIKQPSLFTGARAPPKGVLLYGPPGTGKSYLAKAVATDARASCFSVTAADIKSKWLGESELAVKALFEVARMKAPSIIFIDEVDSLAASRSDHGEADRALDSLVGQLLVEIEGIRVNEDKAKGAVLVIGATNRPWNIDSAMRSRFERRVDIPLPDAEARTAMFGKLLKGTTSDIQQADLIEMGVHTEGFSGRDIRDVVANAVMEPVVHGCLKATHFRLVAGSNMLTPCSISDSGAMEMTCDEVPDDRLISPPVTMEDFQRVIRRSRSSVGQDELQKYVKWTEDFGRDGA